MKLNIGCGSVNLPGYINVDIRYLPGVDIVDNAKYLKKFKNEMITEIYACHILEHFSRWEYKSALKNWYDILSNGGALRISVPDFDAIMNFYQKTNDLEMLIGLLYGGQDYEFNFHHYCWNFETLKKDLEQVGFINVYRYNWEVFENADIDDYSKAYLPHNDRKNGILMSLNVFCQN